MLLIQATDMDGGTARAFDAVAAAREAVATGDTELLSDILLSSAAIPGAFPPREIQGRLYADGGIASNFFYGGPMDESDTFGATWRREHPNAPIPKTRYWVIINEYIQPIPVTVQPNVAGDRRAQPLCRGALGGSHRAASSLRAGGSDNVARRRRRRGALGRRAANLETTQRSALR